MNENNTKILIFSSDDKLQRRINQLFSGGKLTIETQSINSEFFEQLDSSNFDGVLLLSSLCRKQKNGCGGMLNKLSESISPMHILLLIDREDQNIIKLALKAGIYRYARLPIKDDELRLLVETMFDKSLNGNGEYTNLHKIHDGLGEIVGRSGTIQQVYHQIYKAAEIDIPVLLLGETGTGKDLVAYEIHKISNRKDGPFIPVNLGAMPTELVPSELFGHNKGAFTGATEQHPGVFEQGQNGTVFLDEIEAMDEKTQVGLLRLIEQMTFRRLGGKQGIHNNVRLIAASNQNLEHLVKRGAFRKDLFYRLDVFRISLPALRQRHGDIFLLIDEYLKRYNELFNKNILRIKPECYQMLENYEWPGNVRELKNVIQRAVIACDEDEITPEHLPPRFLSGKPKKPTITFEVGTPLDQVEREMVLHALSISDNNRKRAAELLGISRRAIYNKLRKHNIQ